MTKTVQLLCKPTFSSDCTDRPFHLPCPSLEYILATTFTCYLKLECLLCICLVW